MEEPPCNAMRTYFAHLTDPRRANARHRLLAMIVLPICAVICGADGWEDSEEDGPVQAPWLAELFDVPHGIPAHDPCRRVLSRLDSEALPRCFLAWTQALHEATDGEIVAIDGKTLRRAFAYASSLYSTGMSVVRLPFWRSRQQTTHASVGDRRTLRQHTDHAYCHFG